MIPFDGVNSQMWRGLAVLWRHGRVLIWRGLTVVSTVVWRGVGMGLALWDGVHRFPPSVTWQVEIRNVDTIVIDIEWRRTMTKKNEKTVIIRKPNTPMIDQQGYKASTITGAKVSYVDVGRVYRMVKTSSA